MPSTVSLFKNNEDAQILVKEFAHLFSGFVHSVERWESASVILANQADESVIMLEDAKTTIAAVFVRCTLNDIYL